MRRFWRLVDRFPLVVVSRKRLRASERNAFEIGRDYERGQAR